MKSIRDFIEGKIRRSETEAILEVVDGPPDPELGAHQGTLLGPRGQIAFFEDGMLIHPDLRVPYAALEEIDFGPGEDSRWHVDLILKEGQPVRLVSSREGGEVVHATLRWIGHTRLRRTLSP